MYYFDFKNELFTKTGMIVFTIFHLTDTHREKVRVTAWQVTQGRGGDGSLLSTVTAVQGVASNQNSNLRAGSARSSGKQA